MEDYSYMCGECFQFWDSNERFIHHTCHTNMDNTSTQGNRIEVEKRDKAKATYAGPESSESVLTDSTIVHISNEELCDQTLLKSTVKSVVTTEDDDTIVEGEGKKRKKYQAMADEYRVNRIMRDKDFKLGRTHLYSFKDTLGDWDERSTKLLIQLVHKYPKSHFILSAKAERRLEHWEGIHQEMEIAGYTFTVLQLRMRWREVLQKYRWTVDYNDDHEIKKKCEYFDEMNELFGDWDEEATRCLLKQMHQINLENKKKKIVRIGFAGWERITSSLNSDGHRFTIDMVEARWRNMVTLYKTMVDHNALPNVEPHSVAYKEELQNLMTYIPKRRHMYEKVKGRSVKMERFPTNGVKVLLQAYKDCIGLFMDQETRNASVWDQIKQNLEEEGYKYTTVKLKDILNGIIKGYEKSQYHNSLPGAIRRDVPYYRELSEIYGVHGRWPHIQISRSMDMRNKRKFRLRLQASQQLWSSEESRALLEIYPDILEAHVNQNVSHQASDLWLQVAKAYAATGFAKRDVPEIAVHIGLLRLGYAQGNLFPFLEEMRKVKETEEAVCYSPDVSKFMGDVEVIYWGHEAVKHLLDLYLKHQESVTAQSRNGVFNKIRDDMQSLGYGYTKDQIYDHFKTLITQYRTRTSKLWGETVSSRKSSNPTGAPYLEKLEKVWQLRRKMSLSWTSGVSPLSDEALCIVYKVACEKAEELFINSSCTDEKKIVPQLIEQVQSYIRTKKLLEDVPRSRQIRLHLVSALKRFLERKEQNCFIAKLHKLLEDNDMTNFYTNLKKQEVPNFADKSIKRQRKCQASAKRRGKKRKPLEYEKSLTDDDSSDDIYHSGIFDDEPSSPLVSQISERGRSSSTSTSSSSRCVEKSNQYTQSKFDRTCDLEKQNEDNLYNIDISKTEGDCTSCQTGRKERYSGKCPVKERKGRDGGLSAVVSEDSVQHAVLELEDNKEGGFSYVKCYTNTKKAGGGCRTNCGKVVIKTSVKTNKIGSNSKSDITLDLPKDVYSTDCSDSFITENDRKYFNSRKREKKEYNDCSISNFSESDSFNFNEDSFGDKLEHESLYEKVKGEPETRVIHTRSGRKTRFTFFTDSLNENFEDEVKNNGHNSIYVSEEPRVRNKQVDKSTQSDVGTPIKRKRGRPCKPKEPKAPFYYEVEDDGVSLIANVGSANKGTRKRKRGRPCKVRETTDVSYDNLINDERWLIEKEESANESNPSSTKLRDKETNSIKSELIHRVDYVLEMYQAERKEKENELLHGLEKHQAEHSIVLKQMLYFFKNLKSTGKLDSKIR